MCLQNLRGILVTGSIKKLLYILALNPTHYTHTEFHICWVGQGARARVILVLRECIWNDPMGSLVIPAIDDTGSLGSPRQLVYPPSSMLPPWVTASHFLVGKKRLS